MFSAGTLLFGLIAYLAIIEGGHAGSCFSSICQNPFDMCDEEPEANQRTWQQCMNRPAQGEQWACADPALPFPTVDCLVADMRTCGVVGQGGAQTVFYSFGCTTVIARTNVRDTLTPPGVMFNDALLGDDEYLRMIYTHPNYAMSDTTNKNPQGMTRQNVFVARYSEALATVSTGAILFVVNARDNGQQGGGLGAYQNPLPSDVIPNAWRTYEFPTLQRNPDVTSVTSIDATNGFTRTVDWQPNNNDEELPPSNAASLAVPAAAVSKMKIKRDSSVCAAPASSGSIAIPSNSISTLATSTPASGTLTSKSNSAGPTVTAPPGTPSCNVQFEDPDSGINTEYCVCEGSSTLPFLTIPSATDISQSCSYTSLPSTGTIEPSNGFGPPVTYAGQCQVCTPVGEFAQTCTSIPNCHPQAAAATVQVGSSPVHVGTLTGTALYTSISSALDVLCPTVSQTEEMTACSTNSVVIGGIDFVDLGFLDKGGELVVKVESSSYNQTSLRDAMINSAALTAQNSAQGSNNCYQATFDVEELGKRDIQPWLSSTHWTDSFRRWLSPPSAVTVDKRDHPHAEEEHATWCNAASFAGVQYYSQNWRDAANPGPTDYIDVSWDFQVGPGGDFACEFLQDLITALATIQPEFEVEGVELAEEIGAICTEALGHING